MAQNKLDIKAEAKNLNFFYADGTKAWWLHDEQYNDVHAWAKDVLKSRHEPHDEAAIQLFIRRMNRKQMQDIL